MQFTFIPGGALLAGTLAVPSVALREKNIIGKNKEKAGSKTQGLIQKTLKFSSYGSAVFQLLEAGGKGVSRKRKRNRVLRCLKGLKGTKS